MKNFHVRIAHIIQIFVFQIVLSSYLYFLSVCVLLSLMLLIYLLFSEISFIWITSAGISLQRTFVIIITIVSNQTLEILLCRGFFFFSPSILGRKLSVKFNILKITSTFIDFVIIMLLWTYRFTNCHRVRGIKQQNYSPSSFWCPVLLQHHWLKVPVSPRLSWGLLGNHPFNGFF